METRDDRGVKLLVSELAAWQDVARAQHASLHLEVRAELLSETWLVGVDNVLCSHPGDCEVYLYIVMPDGSRQATRSKRYRVAEGTAVVEGLRERFRDLTIRWGRGAP